MTILEIVIFIFIFILGLVIGSFLNVLALRLLSEEDFIFKRSKCPKCGEKIAWYDNIPVISFILLEGKCRHCASGISFQYPLVEIITGILFVLVYHFWGYSLKTLFLLFLVANLIVITITDLKEKVIFDMNSIPLIPLGLVYSFFNIGGGSHQTVQYFGIHFNEVFISAVLGVIIGAAFFEIFSRLGYLFSGEYAFGGGDTILGAAFGAWFGWKSLIVILILSMLVQMIVGIPLVVYNFYKNKEYKSLIAMGGLMLSLVMSVLGKHIAYNGDFIVSLLLVIATFVIAGISVYVIFARMRETQSYTFMPFGPPLVVAALLVLFLGDYIKLSLPF